MVQEIYFCCFCTASYVRKSGLNFHIRKNHPEKWTSPPRHTKPFTRILNCPICSVSGKLGEIKNHYERDHSIILNTTTHRFSDVNAFNDWKHETEKEQKAFFKKGHTDKYSNKGSGPRERTTYHCNRSGTYKPRGSKKKKLKMGSVKINGYCPAEMIVKTCNNGVEVTFLSTHVGHPIFGEDLPSKKNENFITPQFLIGDILNRPSSSETILNDDPIKVENQLELTLPLTDLEIHGEMSEAGPSSTTEDALKKLDETVSTVKLFCSTSEEIEMFIDSLRHTMGHVEEKRREQNQDPLFNPP